MSVRDEVPRRPVAGHPRVQTLSEAFDPRANALAALRLAFALAVAVAHAWSVGYGHQPRVGPTDVAALAVDGFFVLSGFLVAGSWTRLASARRFAWHRFLRLMPGFWVCLVVTAFVVAPVAAVLTDRDPASVFTGSDSAWHYVGLNSLLPILRYEIGGVPAPLGGGAAVFNGSLWTLQYEAFCYAALAVLGLAGLLRRRGALLVLVAIVWALGWAQVAGVVPFDVPVLDNEQVLRFLFVFLLGAAAAVWSDRIPVHRGLAGAAVVLVAVGLLVSSDQHLVGGVGFAYLCLYAAVRLPLRREPRWDLSYGLYVYHWPVQLLLALAGVTAWGEGAFAAVSIAGALALAALSWVFVEAPSLRHKGAFWIDGTRPVGSAR